MLNLKGLVTIDPSAWGEILVYRDSKIFYGGNGELLVRLVSLNFRIPEDKWQLWEPVTTLKIIRLCLGLSLREFAKACNMQRSALCEIENGCRFPYSKEEERISEYVDRFTGERLQAFADWQQMVYKPQVCKLGDLYLLHKSLFDAERERIRCQT